jgi:hypothetical protein
MGLKRAPLTRVKLGAPPLALRFDQFERNLAERPARCLGCFGGCLGFAGGFLRPLRTLARQTIVLSIIIRPLAHGLIRAL